MLVQAAVYCALSRMPPGLAVELFDKRFSQSHIISYGSPSSRFALPTRIALRPASLILT